MYKKRKYREGLPFCYVPYKLLFCDSLGWTYACACSALNAYIRVDFVMGISLSDSLYWTFSSAGSAAYTFVCDYICHDLILLVDFFGPFGTIHIVNDCPLKYKYKIINIL